jgi:hypothetical protein
MVNAIGYVIQSCYSIMCIPIHIDSYTISLWHVFIFVILSSIVGHFIGGLFR